MPLWPEEPDFEFHDAWKSHTITGARLMTSAQGPNLTGLAQTPLARADEVVSRQAHPAKRATVAADAIGSLFEPVFLGR
jgi:hypothetical protein